MRQYSTFSAIRLLLLALVVGIAITPWVRGAEVGPIPDKLRDELKLDRFYQKFTDAGGLPVVGSANVSDNALSEAAWIVGRMIGRRQDIIKAMRDNRVRVVVMAADEYTTDVPEHSRLRPKLYWDRRARGLGATRSNPVVSCAEENLLAYPGDPYPNENIFVHEFAHAIHGTGMSKIDPMFDKRLRAAYDSALERGLWKNTYAATNHSEYWAEGVQSWFDDNAPPDALHNEVRTRTKLKAYDATLAKLCEEVFGDGEWRYLRPAKREPEERRHLSGYDPMKLPRFTWRETPLGTTPRVTIQTAAGDFDVELDARTAPEAAAVFLKIALVGGYHSGRFHRAVRDDQMPANGFVAATPNPLWLERLKSMKLDDVPASKSLPKDGTIALVRNGDSLRSFVVLVGSPPEKIGDVVPIGRVVKGMDVVRKILAGPIDGEKLAAPTDIRRVIRTE